LFVAAWVLPLFRERGVPVWDNIWVEDGPVYGQQAVQAGLSSAFHGYFGYLQFIPHALALPVPLLPSAWWSVYFAVSASLVWALAAAYIYRTSAQWISSVACRLALCTIVVLSPASAWETNANISNAMWAGLLVVPFAFLSDRQGKADTAMRSVAVFLGITSSPLALFFLPLGLYSAVVRRRFAEVVVLGSFAAGFLVQVVVTLQSNLSAGESSSWRLVADLYGLRVIGTALTGELPLDALWTDVGEPAVAVIVAVFAGIMAALLSKAAAPTRRLALALITLSFVVFVVPIYGRSLRTVGFGPGIYSLSFTRLTIVPMVLLVWAVAMLVDPVDRAHRPPDGWRRAFLAQTAAVVLLGYSVVSARGAAPGWSASRTDAVAHACADRSDDEIVAIQTTPATFTMRVTCGRLRSG
jgi:hypothetical protein